MNATLVIRTMRWLAVPLLCLLLRVPDTDLMAQTVAAQPPAPAPTAALVPRLSSRVPSDFFSPAVGAERTLDRLQRDFDVYSWETFIALNWPADANGEPQTKTIGEEGDAPTLWETWKTTNEVFLRNGRRPKPWGSKEDVRALLPRERDDDRFAELVDPASEVEDPTRTPGAPKLTLQELLDNPGQTRVITKLGKGHSWFATEQPFDAGPLIDQAGHYARFEILLNRDMFEYVLTNELYHVAGQEAFFGGARGKHVVFPIGKFERDAAGNVIMSEGRPSNGPVGSIVVKAAWKPLTTGDIESGHFHTRKMLIYTPEDSVNGIAKGRFELATLGLVGLHIVHKSEDVAQWNWSTFEHIDNCPDYAEREAGNDDGPTKTYSYFNPRRYNPALPDPDRELNRAPPRPWNPLAPVEESAKAQIVRMIPLTPETVALNEQVQASLRRVNPKSVWQYYMLVSTQWPTRPAGLVLPHQQRNGDVLALSPADILGGPAPVFLGNTTLESYIQGKTPNTSSSCMDCHANATTISGPNQQVQFSDFTYILQRAKRQP